MITNAIFVKMLNDLGLALSLEDMFEQFVGRSMPQCLEIISGLLGLGRPLPDDFVNRFQSRTAAAMRLQLKAVPGIEAALTSVQAP